MPDQDDTWIDRTEPTLEWALRGVMAQSAGYRRFLESLARERARRLSLPQFPVKLQLPTMPERKPAGREENESEVAA